MSTGVRDDMAVIYRCPNSKTCVGGSEVLLQVLSGSGDGDDGSSGGSGGGDDGVNDHSVNDAGGDGSGGDSRRRLRLGQELRVGTSNGLQRLLLGPSPRRFGAHGAEGWGRRRLGLAKRCYEVQHEFDHASSGGGVGGGGLNVSKEAERYWDECSEDSAVGCAAGSFGPMCGSCKEG